jgi:2-dehydropantoate 2-reductase
MTENPSIAIIGAGAVGGYYGGRLAQHGHDVHFLVRGDYDVWRADGLRVKSVAGDFHLPPEQLRVYNSPGAMPKVDLVIVTIKSTENASLPGLVAPLLKDDTTILTLQNGLGNEDFLAGHFGAGRIVGGMAFVCINRVSPGVVHHLDHGFIRVGEFVGAGRSNRSEAIARLFAGTDVKADVVADLHAARWDKQVWNVPFNGLGALLDATTDQLIGSAEGERLVRAVMNEVRGAAKLDGVAIADDVPQKKIDATRTMGAYMSSTQVDRRLGKPMEVEAIFGRPVHLARERGVQLPLLEMLYFSLKRLDGRKVR